jgi:hypothetical protein
VNPKPPGFLATLFIEWRARRIENPIERLRYLNGRAGRSARSARRLVSWRNLAIAAILPLVFLDPKIQGVSDASGNFSARPPVSETPSPKPEAAPAAAGIWKIEEAGGCDSYSNGLRIENRYLAPNYRRAYRVYPPNLHSEPAPELYSKPAGIVFHTTESPQAPFDADYNGTLRQIGRETLEFTRRHHLYHFMIDRFGRVFRVVPESDTAFHAGQSVWADGNGVYLGLNDSFLGVSFEAETRDISEGNYLSQAQIQSGRLLVQMLIDKYSLPPSNCITHSQVSVNAENMRIGNHTDGAGDFPFQQLGLPDNYTLPLPSVCLFGFDYDALYLKSTGFRLWRGLLLADEQVRQQAMERGMTIGQFKKVLRGEYKRITAALELMSALQENQNETEREKGLGNRP